MFKDGIKRSFIFTVLPFGLTSAPYIFTKIIRVLIKYWRSFAIRISVFIDDGFSIDYDYATALKNSKFVKHTLSKAGFIINEEKSTWEPSTSLEWLGIKLDFQTKTYSISSKRIQSIFSSLENIFSSPYVTARKLACFTGKIISTKFVFGSIVRLKTRSLYRVIESRISWDKPFNLAYYHLAIEELLFWKANITFVNSKPITS